MEFTIVDNDSRQCLVQWRPLVNIIEVTNISSIITHSLGHGRSVATMTTTQSRSSALCQACLSVCLQLAGVPSPICWIHVLRGRQGARKPVEAVKSTFFRFVQSTVVHYLIL